MDYFFGNDEVGLKDLKDFGIDIYKKPSFQTLSLIIASPKKLSTYKDMMSSVPHSLERILNDDYQHGNDEIKNRRQVLAKILSLKKSIQASARFTVSEDKSETNSGNNAVLQTLDNTISSYAKKDYINIDEYTIAELMDRNAIIIVDTQSFGDDIMKLFLESMLKKAVMRLRTDTHKPMSVFIDEANRVLFPSIDLHNDVLREASVELIIAIQNEEQMITKFSQTEWDAIKSNIKHQYFIDLQHRITYNSSDFIFTEPLILKKERVVSAEYAYYALEKNQTNITKHFLGETDDLPKKFMVIYDLDKFEHESSILVEDKYGEQFFFAYHGEEIVNEVRNMYPAEAVQEFCMEDYISLTVDHEAIMGDADTQVFTAEEIMCPQIFCDEDFEEGEDPFDDIEF